MPRSTTASSSRNTTSPLRGAAASSSCSSQPSHGLSTTSSRSSARSVILHLRRLLLGARDAERVDVLVRVRASLHGAPALGRPLLLRSGRGRRVGRAWSCTRRTPPRRDGGQSLARRGRRASRRRRATRGGRCSSSSSTEVIVRSRKARSCDTIATPLASRRRRTRSRRSSPAKSRSLVGSSSRNTSKRASRIAASEARAAWPPERRATCAGRAVDAGSPTSARTAPMRASRSDATEREPPFEAVAYSVVGARLVGGERGPLPVRARLLGIGTPVRRWSSARTVSPSRRSASWGR